MERTAERLELVELERLTMGQWARLIGGETAPFGAAVQTLEYRPKDRNVGLRDERGSLIAVGGTSIVTVTVADRERFDVVGFGGLIVHRDWRSRGFGKLVMDRVDAIAATLGPERGLVFCEAHLVAPYGRRGFRLLGDPVEVDQRDGVVAMPISAMWRPLHPSSWPAGTIRVHGLPF